MKRGSAARTRWARLFLAFVSASASTLAAPVDPNASLPAGHPPIAAAAPNAQAGSAPGPVDPNAPLPPGHPSMAAAPSTEADDGTDSELPSGHPPAGSSSDLPKPMEDRVGPARDLRPGAVEVVVQDGRATPLSGVVVTLGILKQEVAEGDSREHRTATTDAIGVARFDALPTGMAYSYRAVVESGGASYAVGPFRLDEMTGQRAELHVYPVSRDLKGVLIGARGTVFVQPREDVFAVEATFNVINVGTTTWVPEGVKLELPPGAKAFRASESMSDTRVEKTKSGELLLLGTFSPGQHEVGFQFQIDNNHDSAKTIEVPMPPRLFEMRVFAERASGMTLEVRGFPDSQSLDGDNGTPLLGTMKQLARGEAPIEKVELRLANIPIPSPGRWYAVAAAAAIAIGGLLQIARKRQASQAQTGAVAEAEGLLLDELVEIERLHTLEKIGPRTYQEVRSELLDALARLSARRVEARSSR